MTDASYQFSKNGTGYNVLVVPASPPKIPKFTLIIIGWFGLTGLTFALTGLMAIFSSPLQGLFSLAIAAGILKLVHWMYGNWNKPRRMWRQQGNFGITSKQLNLDGAGIPIPEIHRFILRNHITDQEQVLNTSSLGIMYDPASLAGAAVGLAMAVNVAGKAVTSAYKKKLARISWRLDVDAGGKATTLGCGMDEVTAHGLMEDTARKVAELRAA